MQCSKVWHKNHVALPPQPRSCEGLEKAHVMRTQITIWSDSRLDEKRWFWLLQPGQAESSPIVHQRFPFLEKIAPSAGAFDLV